MLPAGLLMVSIFTLTVAVAGLSSGLVAVVSSLDAALNAMLVTATLATPSGVAGLTLIALALAFRLYFGRKHGPRGPHAPTTDYDQIRIALENARDGMVLQELDGRILLANKAYCTMMGRTLDEVLGINPLTFALPPEDTPSDEEIASFRYDTVDPKYAEFEVVRNIRKDGTLFYNQISVSFHKAKNSGHFAILVCRDVTRQIEAQRELERTKANLEHLAIHDPLTGLANRAGFLAFAKSVFSQRAPDDPAQPAILHLDIDRFKQINDVHGHAAGDAVIRHVADSLRNCVRRGTLASRLGGDEFIVLEPAVRDTDELKELLDRIHDAVSGTIKWEDRPIQISVSIGGALACLDDHDHDTVLANSDFALYEAKRRGRGRVAAYHGALRARHIRSNELGRHLRREIANGRLSFEFQPTMFSATGELSGFETLARWHHKSEGIIGPDRFINLAQEHGLLAELDFCAMDAMVDQLGTLHGAGHTNMKVGLNASPELLVHPDFLPRLRRQLDAHRLPHNKVVIEVHEGVILGDDARRSPANHVIHDLIDDGFTVLLDDFGTGYAGLSHLTQMPLSGIKIDRSIIGKVLDDTNTQKIVRAVVEMAAGIDLMLVAEGVENRATAAWLGQLGCPVIQGFWISRSMPANKVLSFVEAHNSEAFAIATQPPSRSVADAANGTIAKPNGASQKPKRPPPPNSTPQAPCATPPDAAHPD